MRSIVVAGAPPRLSGERPAVALPPENDLSEGDEPLMRAQQEVTDARSETEALRALAQLANLQRRRGDYVAGLKVARAGLARAQTLGDVHSQIEFLYLIGRIHWNLTDYPQALESHLAELRLAEPLGEAALLARTHGALGATYLRYGRNKEALDHFERGLVLARKAPAPEQVANLLNNLGNYYLSEKNYARAEELHTEALGLREQAGSQRGIADSLTNLGLIAEARGDHTTALDCLQRALAIYQPLKLRRYLANTHRRLATVYRQLGRTDEALAHLGTAQELADTLNSPEVLAAILQEMSLVRQARGEYAAALESERRSAVAAEAMRNEQDRQRMDELHARYEAEQRELEIRLLRRDQELQQAQLRRRRSQNLALGVGLGLGLVLLAAVILMQRARLRVERRLRAATEEARARAEQAERLKSRLLLMASHDLKVPLTALNATAERIAQHAADAGTVRRLAEGMRSDTAHMRGLVRDFLDAVAIEEGNLQCHPARIDLATAAGGVVEGLRTVAESKQQTLRLVPAAAPFPAVHADPDRLRQVFENLVGNALKFTPVGGTITVAAGGAAGWVHVEVSDTGPGLSPADFAKIFSPHRSLSARPTGAREESHGLGLFIARELLTLQGGRLEVQSHPGRGAVFRVLLPAAPPLA